jgi:predicted PurR-regulated permease PerM
VSKSERSSTDQESVPAASSPALTSLLSLQVFAVVIAALYLAREVLVPITVAILLSFVLSPLVDLQRRIRLGRVPSVLISVLIAIGIIGVIGTFIGSQVAQLASHAPEYAVTIERKIGTVRNFATEKMSGLLGRVGHDAIPTSKPLRRRPHRQAAQPSPALSRQVPPDRPQRL